MSGARDFVALGGESVYRGRFFDVRVERYRHCDGEEVSREVVRHSGAVGIVAHDEHDLWLVRQPREVIDRPDLLEIPAGRLDVAGESPRAAAERELAEEIGMGAGSWHAILDYFVSPGFTDERMYLFHASALYAAPVHSEENERIEIVRWPLARLDHAIAACVDAKTLIALQWLARRLHD